jgi:uncharacterized protein YmfQ (DUF2313 family)
MVINLLKSLFPKGSPWNILGEFGKVISGISESINRVYQYGILTLNESVTLTTTDLIQNFFDAFGLENDPTLTLSEKRQLLNSYYIGTGGQSKVYIENQIQKVFPQITLEEYSINADSMVGLGMTGQMQTESYLGWVPIINQDGTFPMYLYKVIGIVSSVKQYLILQDLLKRYAPLTHQPIFINIDFLYISGMVGVGQTGIMEVGREGV